LIEIAKTGRKAGECMAVVMSVFLDLRKNSLGDRLDPRESLPLFHLRQLKDRLLRVIEHDRRVLFLFERLARDVVTRTNKRTHDRLVTDDLDVIFYVGEMRKPVCQVRDRRDSAESLDRAFLL
jgi:hypothetical protein